eukprot:4911110-Lingulodinium_polyedra.AAC.1
MRIRPEVRAVPAARPRGAAQALRLRLQMLGNAARSSMSGWKGPFGVARHPEYNMNVPALLHG